MPTYQVFSSRLNLIHMLGFLSGDRRLGCRQRARGLGRSVCSRCWRRAACPDLGRVYLGLVFSWCFAISLWATVLKESLEITSLKRQAFRFELRELKSFGLAWSPPPYPLVSQQLYLGMFMMFKQPKEQMGDLDESPIGGWLALLILGSVLSTFTCLCGFSSGEIGLWASWATASRTCGLAGTP